jgi:PAS domain-containing protein
VLEQSLSRFISPEETREFTAALREVVEKGVTRNARLNPRSASGEVIPTTLNASALRDTEGRVIGAIGILRDMRELDKARAYAESLIKNAPDPVFVSDLEGKILKRTMRSASCSASARTKCSNNRSPVSSARRRRGSSPPRCAKSSKRA